MNDDIKKAAELLRQGELVAFPTETVYGLGASALSDNAVASIYETKGRPTFNPLIVHIASIESAEQYVSFNDQAKKLASHFWPGPLTIVLPRRKDCTVSLLASAGLDTLAIRMPAHPVAQALLKAAEIPVAAPSANLSGHVSPTLASHVREEFGDKVAMVLDGGACEVGIESTVIDLSVYPPTMLRSGFITRKMIEQVIGKIAVATADSAIKSPGMLERHYAPKHPLRLNATEAKQGEALLAFGSKVPTSSGLNLSQTGNLKEAAANLFRMLRELDTQNISGIAVMPIPNEDLGVAINDRLKRAATPSS